MIGLSRLVRSAEFHAKHGRKLPPMNSASKSCSSCKLNGTWSCPVTKLIDPADALQEVCRIGSSKDHME